MMTVERRVGRFIEIRGSGVVTLEEMGAFRSELFKLMVQAGQRIVACVDMRQLEPFDDAVRGMFVGLMRGDNPHVERSAHLARPGSPYHLQAEEMIAKANNPSRRNFTDPVELLRWLGQTMNEDEKGRLRAFLSEPPQKG